MSRNIAQFILKFAVRRQSIETTVRCYSRWAHRNPAKVLLPFESNEKSNLKKEQVIELNSKHRTESHVEKHIVQNDKEDVTQKLSKQPSEKTKDIKSKRDEKYKKNKFYLSQKKVFDDNNELIYEKLKEGDGRVSTLLVKMKSKKERLRSGYTLVEGWRMIVDGLEAKCKLRYVIFSRIEDLNNLRPFMPNSGVLIYKIPYKEIEMWSDVVTSPGIIGIFETPKPENIKVFIKPLPLQFICDNIRVPGNLGAILRAAVGVGCEKVLLSKGCVDLWDPKVIRSAAGAHFRLPIYQSIDWNEMPKLMEPDTSVFIADSNTEVDVEGSTDPKEVTSGSHLPLLPYYGVEFATLKHVTLILGGETEGISDDSYALAAKKNGLRLNVPLSRGVDSLNTGMATAVIAFEIRKQLIQAWTQRKLDRQMLHAT